MKIKAIHRCFAIAPLFPAAYRRVLEIQEKLASALPDNRDVRLPGTRSGLWKIENARRPELNERAASSKK